MKNRPKGNSIFFKSHISRMRLNVSLRPIETKTGYPMTQTWCDDFLVCLAQWSVTRFNRFPLPFPTLT